MAPGLRSRPIVLAGFMGAGKTTVGRALARRLRRPYSDLHREVEYEAGARIAEQFPQYGEPAFRAR